MAAGLTKAYAAGLDANRRARRSRTAVLELLDKHVDPDTLEPNHPESATEPFTVVATVTKGWDWERIGRGQGGEERVKLQVAESDTATVELLRRCDFRIEGVIYDAATRNEPLGEQNRIWSFIMTPSG